MLVEHQFITTREAADALAAAEDLLGRFGFRRRPGAPGAAPITTGTLEVHRGKSKPNPTQVLASPASVRLDYDRGRVIVAASVTEYRKVLTEHRELGLSIVGAVESLLAHGWSIDEAAATMRATQDQVVTADRKRTTRRRITLAAVLVFVILCFTLLIAVIVNLA